MNPDRIKRWRATSRLSSTETLGESAMFWNVRATPSAAIRCGRSFVSSRSP